MPLWLKIVFFIGIIFFLSISIYVCLDDVDIYQKVLIVLLGIFFGGGCLIYEFYLITYNIYIDNDYIKVRKLFKTYTFNITDITNIIYKQVAFGSYTYIIVFSKIKVEIAPLMKNKSAMDNFLNEHGVFKKFPRVDI